MIERIVRLAFDVQRESEFLKVFKKHQIHMKNLDDCYSLSLKKDLGTEGVFFTHSIWESEHALNNYRSSPYFLNIWAVIKPWFIDRAQAWTVTNVEFEK